MTSKEKWIKGYTRLDMEALRESDRRNMKESVFAVSKIFQYGKTTVPKPVRVRLDVKDGDKMIWSVDDLGNITVSKVLDKH
jgi:hypothetical protein